MKSDAEVDVEGTMALRVEGVGVIQNPNERLNRQGSAIRRARNTPLSRTESLTYPLLITVSWALVEKAQRNPVAAGRRNYDGSTCSWRGIADTGQRANGFRVMEMQMSGRLTHRVIYAAYKHPTTDSGTLRPPLPILMLGR